MRRGVIFLAALLVFPNLCSSDSLSFLGVGLSGQGVGAGGGGEEEPETPRLMPLGDSITRGSGDSPVFGYRDHLQDALGIGMFAFVGPFQNPSSDATYDVDHAGIGGNDTLDIIARLPGHLTDHFPLPNPADSLILLMIGTNDIKDGFDEGDTVDNVESIIDTIHAWDSTINVYVALIIPVKSPWDDFDITSYNAALNTMLVAKQASKSNLFIADMNTAFKANPSYATAYYSDSLHPNDTGYQVISNTWETVIEANQ